MIIEVGTRLRVKGVDDGYLRVVRINVGCGPEMKWSTSVQLEINRQGYPRSITHAKANEITRGINNGTYTLVEPQ